MTFEELIFFCCFLNDEQLSIITDLLTELIFKN